MVDILFPTSSSPGKRNGESAGRLVNMYAEKMGDQARAGYVRRQVPGIRAAIDTTYPVARGMHEYNGNLLVAQTDKLVRVNYTSGAYSSLLLGTLNGDKRVTFARNNKAPVPDIVCVTENGAFNCTTDGAPTSFVDGDLPQPNSVCFQDGYFFFTIRDGRVFASGINDVTVDALDFATAESSAGGLLRGVSFSQQLLLFGPNTIEAWQNTANPEGFPFSRAAIVSNDEGGRVGLAGTFAVAGTEEGFASSLCFVGSDDRVYRLAGGYTAQRVSTPDVERAIEAVADKEDLDAMVYMAGGHPFWQVSGPNFTWVLDLSTGFWHERESWLVDRCRSYSSCYAFGQWHVGDRTTGDIGIINPEFHEEYSDPLGWEVWSTPAAAFPNRVAVPRADFDFVVGQGIASGRQPIETQPRVSVMWSDDGGNSWSQAVIREIGRQGEYKARVSVNRTGMTGVMGRIWKLVGADPVYTGLLGGATTANVVSR